MRSVEALAAGFRWMGAAKTSAAAVAHSLVSRVSILLVNVATGIIVARTLGPAGRGAAAAIALWPLVISGLLTLGLPAALRYEVRRRMDRPAELFSCALLMGAVLGAFAFVVGFTIVPRVLMRYPPPVVVFAQGMMLFAPLMLWNAILQAFYESQGDFKRSNAMIYVPPVLTLTGLLFLAATHTLSPYSVAIMYEAPFALMTVTTVVRLRRFLKLPPNLLQRVRSLLHYGVRAYGIDILNTLAGQIDQAMVVGLLSAASFGLYAVAISGSRILSVIGLSLNSVLLPTASGLDAADAVTLVSRSARLMFACTFVAALAFFVALPILIPLAYGKQYMPVVGLTRLLLIGMVCGSTTSTLTQAFMAIGRPGIATILQCAGLGMTVPLMLLLIPHFGLTGAAYAVDISNGLRLGLVILSYPIFLNHGIPRLLPSRQDIDELFIRVRRVTAS